MAALTIGALAGGASAHTRSARHSHARARHAHAVARLAGAPRVTSHMKFLGTVNLAALAAQSTRAASSAKAPRAASPLRLKTGSAAGGLQSAPPNPNPKPTPLINLAGPPLGFVGITEADQSAASGQPLEPPDQGLCAHNGIVMEGVNLAVSVYGENGVTYMPPVSLNAFYGLPPVVSNNGHATTYGPFLSDPRCYYDPQTARWFMAALEIDVNPFTGALGYRSSELLAVSQTSDPTGSYGLFSIDTTNDGSGGTIAQPNCPCFGDQPRIGADANGFYISADSYPIHGLFNSNGGMLYAMSKTGLAAAADGTAAPPPVVAIDNGAVTIQGYPANAVQPATTPEGGAYAPNTEYFLSTPDFNGFATSGGKGAKAVVLWALTNTSSLNSGTPSVTLTDQIIPSEPYTPPVPASQKPGPHPLGQSLGDPVPVISVNDDRMQQVEYTRGEVYSSLNTGVGSGAATRSGIAWFAVRTAGTTGMVAHQGYLAAGDTTSLMYPAIGLKAGGAGAMTFSLSGPSNYPSAAYIPFNQGPAGSAITIVAPGVLPEDGFTCYAQFGFGPPCRWGDYSAASSDGAGNIVIADEMISDHSRDAFANWSTYIATIKP